MDGEGYEIITALNGRKALEMAASAKADLVLMDFPTPCVDGLELCRRLRQSEAGSDAPIIFISGTEDRETIVRALSLGGTDYVAKPFGSAEL